MRLALTLFMLSTSLLTASTVCAADTHPPAIVPHGQTYVFFKHGRPIATLHSMERVARSHVGNTALINCIMVTCPSSIPDKTATCWLCT